MTNLETYSDPKVVAHYRDRVGMFEAELRLLDSMKPGLAKGFTLDLGVGAGRTVDCLSRLSRGYLGVDYSEPMITMCRRRFPDRKFRVADVRDLSGIADRSVTHAFFLFNGLDYLDHSGRMQALAEIHRVLTSGGTFLFSSHNRDYVRVGKKPWEVDGYPFREKVSRSVHYLRFTRRRHRMRDDETHCGAYEILNDDAHDYSLLTYYIGPHQQVTQLFDARFLPKGLYNEDAQQTTYDSTSRWFYYLAVKP